MIGNVKESPLRGVGWSDPGSELERSTTFEATRKTGHRRRAEPMGDYTNLRARIDAREVIILDGAIGTQLQRMEVPMSHDAWAAIALETHPFTVRRLHELYIEAGVDVITTNTYSSARHNLLPLGLGDKVHELNLRAVMLAQDARDRLAKERPVWIGGSVSNYGLMAGAESGWKDYQ